MLDDLLDKLPGAILGLYILYEKYLKQESSSDSDSKGVGRKEFDELDNRVDSIDKENRENSKQIATINGRLQK